MESIIKPEWEQYFTNSFLRRFVDGEASFSPKEGFLYLGRVDKISFAPERGLVVKVGWALRLLDKNRTLGMRKKAKGEAGILMRGRRVFVPVRNIYTDGSEDIFTVFGPSFHITLRSVAFLGKEWEVNRLKRFEDRKDGA